MKTIDIHSKIELGSAGTLCVAGEELACRVGDLSLTARLVADRFVMSGGLRGEHSLAAESAITSADRLLAHWHGYVESNQRYHLQTGGAL